MDLGKGGNGDGLRGGRGGDNLLSSKPDKTSLYKGILIIFPSTVKGYIFYNHKYMPLIGACLRKFCTLKRRNTLGLRPQKWLNV
jgi:hypothetical protein